MKNIPDPAALLDDVLAEPASTTDASLASVLRAVRARRRRQHLSAALTVLSLALIAAWLVVPRPVTLQTPAVTATSTPAPAPHAERGWSLNGAVERVGTMSLTTAERVTTSSPGLFFARIYTQPGITPEATDEDLFTLAGGRGVALARMGDGRTELLFAHAPQ